MLLSLRDLVERDCWRQQRKMTDLPRSVTTAASDNSTATFVLKSLYRMNPASRAIAGTKVTIATSALSGRTVPPALALSPLSRDRERICVSMLDAGDRYLLPMGNYLPSPFSPPSGEPAVPSPFRPLICHLDTPRPTDAAIVDQILKVFVTSRANSWPFAVMRAYRQRHGCREWGRSS